MSQTTLADHLAPFKNMACIYCRKVGADPEQQIPVPHPIIAGSSLFVPRWRLEAERLLDLSAMLSAIKESATEAPKVLVS